MDNSNIVEQYKLQGHFDSKRKQLLDEFQNGTSGVKGKLDDLLEELVDLKVQANPELVVENRGKLVAQIQASLTKQQMYSRPTPKGPRGLNHSAPRLTKVEAGPSETPSSTITQKEADIIKQINELLNGYVKEVVSGNEQLNKDLEQSLARIERQTKQ
ncbi:hypothetical protein FOA43_002221 [Brettanomyces nanus]|uniref:BOD1/SHG1 domain-containing protein n=1 Tax=Eeniella nana TaxID=13502 RepID=A0A875S6S9_EENNA|nr:uncharacterized protein FOA43_002221 [Brettanomyces nanus]QPG74884.1 hypothetical protein FOA43_002221 [Brettanomyces nanus]